MRAKVIMPAFFVCLLTLPSLLHAALIPETMNYQGYLTDSSDVPLGGAYNMTFSIYDVATLGGALWSEGPSAVTVTNGIFNVTLGLTNPIQLPFRKKYWLGITVAPDAEMTPRHELTNASYALASRKVVYQQVFVVAQDGGDAPTIAQALALMTNSPAWPSNPNSQFLIEVQAGTYNEGNLNIPDYVTIRGQGWEATQILVDHVLMSTPPKTGAALESLKLIKTAGISPIIDMSGGAVECYVRDVWIETNMPSVRAIDMTGAIRCAVLDSYIHNTTVGPGWGIWIAGINDSRVENTVINIQSAALNGSYGISDGGAGGQMVEGYILKNTIQYQTAGGPGASFGIGVAATGLGQVSYNVFLYGAVANDIVDSITGVPPVWGAGLGNPHGVANQDSLGAMLGF